MDSYNKNIFLQGFFLSLLLILVYFSYANGLTGVFFFDDMPNLSPLANYPQYGYWDRFWLFTLEGTSGPTGRPISLASFYLNDNHWPTKAAQFIASNIYIHLFNGILVFWLSFKLSKILDLSQKRQMILALLATALWILHPLHATTVLYVIQRMTELSATFMLSGLIFYLYGREQLKSKKLLGFFTLFVGVGLSLLLALFSKENGILLVAYILVIEFFLLRPFKQSPPIHFSYWLIPAVILPFIAILIYLGLRTDPSSYGQRDFSLTERLLTQPRILFDYLQQIMLPRMNNLTLFHDDYIISKSFFNPITTLPAIIGIAFLIISAFIIRKKYPIIGFSIAWFFAGHLIESTVLPLEMYFEHRNYLPVFGISFALAWYASTFTNKHKGIVVLIIGGVLSLYTFILIQNATLWGNPLLLTTSWYSSHPNSERSLQTYQLATKAFGVKPILIKNQNNTTKPGTTFYTASIIRQLTNDCANKMIKPQQIHSASLALKNNLITSSTHNRLNDFMKVWLANECTNIKTDTLKNFFTSLLTINSIQNNPRFKRTTHYLLSHVYRMKGDLENTMLHIDKAYEYEPSAELLLQRVEYLASAGLFKEALKVLNNKKSIEDKGFRVRLTLRIKQKEFDRVEKELIGKISND